MKRSVFLEVFFILICGFSVPFLCGTLQTATHVMHQMDNKVLFGTAHS